jgi:tripartite ATP-independent transporter DctP family solute receptor
MNMKRKVLCITMAIVILFSLALSGCGGSQKPQDEAAKDTTKTSETASEQKETKPATEKVFRLSWPPAYDEKHGHTKAALAMNKVLEEKTGGTVRFEFYPGGQLGNERDVFEAVQMGTIDASIMSGTVAAGFTNALLGFDMPYLFDNSLDFYKEVVTSDVAKKLFKKMEEEAGVKGIAFLINPGRDFYFRKPVTTLADMKGLKLRSMESEIHLETYRALGLAPTPLPYSEVYTAMQTGTVDGFEDVSASVQANKTYETASHVVTSGHFNAAPIVIMSIKAWNSLTPDEQKAMEEAGIAGQNATLEHYREQVPKTIQHMRDSGLVVTEINMEEAKKLVQPVIDKYAAQIPEVKEVVDAVNEMKAAKKK